MSCDHVTQPAINTAGENVSIFMIKLVIFILEVNAYSRKLVDSGKKLAVKSLTHNSLIYNNHFYKNLEDQK